MCLESSIQPTYSRGRARSSLLACRVGTSANIANPPGALQSRSRRAAKSRQPVSRLKAGPIVVELRCKIVQQVLVQEAARTTQPSSLLQSEACIQGGEADHIACQSEGEYLACLKSLG